MRRRSRHGERSRAGEPSPVYNPAGSRRDAGTRVVSNISSYARRVEDRVLVVLHVPGLSAMAAGDVRLRFVSGEEHFGVPASVTPASPGLIVTAQADADLLGDRLWRLVLVSRDRESTWKLEARLLAKAGQPVALLPGPAPRSDHGRSGP